MPDASRWLDQADSTALIELLPRLSGAGQELVETRCVAPWRRRQSRIERRDAAILALARSYPDLASGHSIAEAIRKDMRHPASAAPHRRRLVTEALSANKGHLLGDRRLREVLAGLGRNQDVKLPKVSAFPEPVKEAVDVGFSEAVGAGRAEG
jgi:hypothetical protein